MTDLYGIYLVDRPRVFCGYDQMCGFVVVAKTEYQAREVASRHHANEGEDVWLDTAQSSCILVGHARKEAHGGIVLDSFKAG